MEFLLLARENSPAAAIHPISIHWDEGLCGRAVIS
jgi:hypothetical protein